MSSDDDLTERLRRLGLRVGRDALAAFLSHVHKSRLGPTETVEQLVDLEERARVAVNLRRRTRFACLGSFKTFERFDWNHPEKIDRTLIERLVELEFVDRGENVLLKGGSGLGKTMIAQNLAQAALTAGFTVRFSTLAAALADLLGQKSMPAFERRLRRYTSPDLLVLDELVTAMRGPGLPLKQHEGIAVFFCEDPMCESWIANGPSNQVVFIGKSRSVAKGPAKGRSQGFARIESGSEALGDESDAAKLGGYADWVQKPEVVACSTCRAPMDFVLQIGAEIRDFGDAGIGYVFLCPREHAGAALWQGA